MIEVIRGDDVWTVRINRPDKANSVTREMLAQIDSAAAEAEAQGVAAFVLTGEGRVFSAGADLDEARAGLATDGIWEQLSTRIANMRCLTIAALNGTLAGGAFGMVLACDLRVAVPGAKFFYPVMKLGFLPQPSDPGRMQALIGPSRSKMILMASQKIDAETALNWGLIDQIAQADALSDTIDQLTEAVRAASPDTRAGIKGMIV